MMDFTCLFSWGGNTRNHAVVFLLVSILGKLCFGWMTLYSVVLNIQAEIEMYAEKLGRCGVKSGVGTAAVGNEALLPYV